jgi:signal transduction histidine kinase
MDCCANHCISRRVGSKRFGWTSRAIVGSLVSCFACPATWADPPLAHSVLILDQSAPLRPWATKIIGAIQASKSDGSGRPISYHIEHLDLFGFGRRQYDDNLLKHLADKYREQPFDVILSIGPGALDFAVKLRATAWPAASVVFTGLSEQSAPHTLPPKTTGIFVQKTLANMVNVARIIVPNLKRLVLVGYPFEGAVYYPQFAQEIPKVSTDFEIIDFMGLPVREIRKRIASLPHDSAVLYFGINADPERRYTTAVEALSIIAQATNRPIIGDADTELDAGAIGGFVLVADEVGKDAGRLLMRILNGEDASDIAVTTDSTLKPIFDWRQLQKWNISERMLPAGSEIRFRPPSMWEQYRWQIVMIATAIFMQMLLIVGLFIERHRRRYAEATSRQHISELAHMNRSVTAGELSASIAHEVKQPLAAISANASAALRWLTKGPSEVGEARAALERIVNAAHHAGDVIDTIRAMFKKSDGERFALNANVLIEEVLALLHGDLQRRRIFVETHLPAGLPEVMVNRVQLQQVILNLLVNAAEAMDSTTGRDRVLTVTSDQGQPSNVLITVEDSGPGMDLKDIERIFEPFYTTKPGGMGMGLAICQSIIQSHDGRLFATPSRLGGLALHIALPAGPSGRTQKVGGNYSRT